MANPLGDGGSGLRLTPPDGAKNIKLDNLGAIPLTDKKTGEAKDPLADLAKEAKRARRLAQASGLSVTSGAPGASNIFSFGITEAGGVALEQTKIGLLLQQTKQHLARGECREALEKVTELLKEQPGHPEGLFLKAACHYGLGEPRNGLKALAEMRAVQEAGAEVTKLVASSANDLRIKLRAALLPGVLQENMDRLKEGLWEAVITDTDELIGLDPAVWEFYYLRADGHSVGGKTEEAWAGVATAFKVAAPKEPESLVNLREKVRGQLAQMKLGSALKLYKERRYGRARAAVAELEPELASARIVTLFDNYLALLDTNPPGNPADIPPPGEFADSDPLNFFLTREELPLMRVMRQMEQFALAVEQGREALKYAPHFPYLRYLMALSLYQNLMSRFRTEEPPTLDEGEAIAREAREHALGAHGDPELTDAPEVVDVLDRLLVTIAEIREEQKKWQVDWEQLQPLVEQYLTIMRSAENGIENVAHHERMTQGMNTIVRRAAPLAGKMISIDGQDMLNRLNEATSHALSQLSEIRQTIVEGEPLNALWERLAAQVDRVKGGYLTQYTVYSFRSELQSIQSAAQTLRRRLTIPSKIQSCDELIRTITEILWKIGG